MLSSRGLPVKSATQQHKLAILTPNLSFNCLWQPTPLLHTNLTLLEKPKHLETFFPIGLQLPKAQRNTKTQLPPFPSPPKPPTLSPPPPNSPGLAVFWHVRGLPIAQVPQHRVPHVREVRADLMHPPRGDAQRHQRPAPRRRRLRRRGVRLLGQVRQDLHLASRKHYRKQWSAGCLRMGYDMEWGSSFGPWVHTQSRFPPGEHPNPTTRIGSKMSGAHTPKWCHWF